MSQLHLDTSNKPRNAIVQGTGGKMQSHASSQDQHQQIAGAHAQRVSRYCHRP